MIAWAFCSTERLCDERDGGGEPGLLAGGGRDEHVLVGQAGGVLGGHDHVGAVGEQHDLLGGHLVDPGEQVVGGGVERRSAVDRVHAELVEQRRAARRR